MKFIKICLFTADHLQNVYFLTNKNQRTTPPSIHDAGGWITCYYSSAARGDQYTVTCDRNYQTPITRWFGIAAHALSVGLREVQIYGYGM